MIAALSLFMLASLAEAPGCVQELNALLQREDYDALLTAARACEAETGHPRPLYFMGVAHLAKRRPDLAIRPLQRYLDGAPADEPPSLRTLTAARLEQALAAVSVVELRVMPAGRDGDVRVTITCAEWDRPLVVFLSELEQRDGHAVVQLPPGSYHLTVARAGYLPERRELSVELAGDEVSVPILLRLRAPPPLPPASRSSSETTFPGEIWAGAWSGFAGAMLVAGVPAFAVGTVNVPRLCTPDPQSIDQCRSRLARAMMLRAGGAAMLGAGAGLLTGGLTGLVRVARKRQVAWAVEAGAAAALMASGVALLAVSQRSFNRINNSVDPAIEPWGSWFEASLEPSWQGFTSGAVLLGAGVGLGVSAVFGLASPGIVRRATGATARWNLEPDGFSINF